MTRGTRPPTPAFTARWTISGKYVDIAPWSLGFHLLFSPASIVDASTVHRLHEDLLLIWELAFPQLAADGVTGSTSRFLATTPTTQVGELLFLTAQGARGPGVPAPIAVGVEQIVQARGRGRQGHFYLPPPSLRDVQFGTQLTPGAVSSYSTVLADVFNELNRTTTADFPSVHIAVLHRQANGAWLGEAIPQPVDVWRVRSDLSTQVRRLRRAFFP